MEQNQSGAHLEEFLGFHNPTSRLCLIVVEHNLRAKGT